MKKTIALAWSLGLACGGVLLAADSPLPEPAYGKPTVGEMAPEASPPTGLVGKLRVGKAKGPGASVELVHPPHGEWTLTNRAPEGSPSILKKLPSERSVVLMPRTFIASFPVREEAGLDAVVWEYAINEGGMRFDFNTTYLAICVLDKGLPVGECRTEKVAYSDVALYRREKPEDVWLYWALDSTERATKSDIRLLLRDHDHDGYRDLVIWRRQCGSISLADVAARERDPKTFKDKVECDLDFVLEGEELLWMRFNPQLHAFGDPIKDNVLPAPPKDDWRQLPNLGLLFIR
jgi:hypothetical protein